jgi:hypothetical protein
LSYQDIPIEFPRPFLISFNEEVLMQDDEVLFGRFRRKKKKKESEGKEELKH